MTIQEQLSQRKTAMKTAEVAELLGMSIGKVNRGVREGRIPHFKIFKSTRFDPAVLCEWLRATEIDVRAATIR